MHQVEETDTMVNIDRQIGEMLTEIKQERVKIHAMVEKLSKQGYIKDNVALVYVKAMIKIVEPDNEQTSKEVYLKEMDRTEKSAKI